MTSTTSNSAVTYRQIPQELDVVMTAEGQGTIVDVYNDGEAYEVEFQNPPRLKTMRALEVSLLSELPMTGSGPAVEITFDAGLSEEEEDRLLVEWMKINYPPGSGHYTAPLWMCIAWWWPNCFTTAYFWFKESFCEPDYIVSQDDYDQP